MGQTLVMGDAGDPLCLQAHLFIQHVWEGGLKCRSSSHGSSHVGGRNSTDAVCCYLVQTILARWECPVFLARQPCWTLPPSGWVRAYQPRGRLTEPCSCPGHFYHLSLPSYKAALLNLAHFLRAGALPSQPKRLWHGLAHVKVSSQSI
jgi:hypothetical protein